MEEKRITLRMPSETYEALREESQKMGISINELINLKINPPRMEFQQESSS